MAKIIKLGSLYFNGQPQEITAPYNDERISFGDSVSGKEIPWVRLQSGLLIADRCVCTMISWKQLHENGFVFGAPVTIDGKVYLCRCLRVGTKEGELNEWNAALDEAGDDDKFWRWKYMYFWGQDTSKYKSSTRAVRGWFSARGWNYRNATYRDVNVGFRPVLEHLGSVPWSPDTLVGKTIKVYCPSGVTIEGHLVNFSDYDIVLKPGSPVPTDCSWITRDGFNIIISRGNITWLREA